MGGFSRRDGVMLASPATAPLLTRERVSPLYFFSYTFIPLSSIAFPHIGIFCLTAERLSHFRKTDRALSALHAGDLAAVGLPWGRRQSGDRPCRPSRRSSRRARTLATQGPRCRPRTARRAARARPPATTSSCGWWKATRRCWLASLLGAAVMAAVMASDSQILALSTMFTEDVFAFYGGPATIRRRPCRCRTGRVFVVVLTAGGVCHRDAVPQSIFDIATQYAFAGYAALAPLLVAALFWKGSTEVGRAGGRGVDGRRGGGGRRAADDDPGAASRPRLSRCGPWRLARSSPGRARGRWCRFPSGRADDARLGRS